MSKEKIKSFLIGCGKGCLWLLGAMAILIFLAFTHWVFGDSGLFIFLVIGFIIFCGVVEVDGVSW